jgi:hypothetical protein
MPRRTSAFFPAVVTWKSGGVMANARFMQFNANQVRAFSKCSETSTLGALQKTENKARVRREVAPVIVSARKG